MSRYEWDIRDGIVRLWADDLYLGALGDLADMDKTGWRDLVGRVCVVLNDHETLPADWAEGAERCRFNLARRCQNAAHYACPRESDPMWCEVHRHADDVRVFTSAERSALPSGGEPTPATFCTTCGHRHAAHCLAGGDPPSYDVCGCPAPTSPPAEPTR